MHIHRSLLGWGVFFILLGAIPLAVSQGLVDESVVENAWQLWPLILVGAGVGLVLRGSRFDLVGGLIVAVTAGLIGGSLIATGARFPAIAGCGIGDGSGTPFATQRGDLGDTARVTLQLDCGDVEARTAGGSEWTLEGSDEDGRGPEISRATDRLTIESRQDTGWSFGDADQWRLVLPTGPSIALDLVLNAGSGSFALAGARVPDVTASMNAGSLVLDLGTAAEVGRLDASVNAGSMSITLPDASLSGSVSANAGSVELCIPAGVGIRIRTQDNLTASYDLARGGLVQSGSTWETPGYGSATSRVDLSASANAGSISLNPEDGCGE